MNVRMKASGFTIVELLIVIVVIGILAAITIVAFNGVQNRANDSAVQADIANIGKKIEAERITSGGGYPYPLTASLGLSASKSSYAPARNNLYYCISEDFNTFALGSLSTSGNGYMYVSGKGVTKEATVSGASICAQAGRSAWNMSYAQLGFNQDQSGDRGWASWLR